MTTFQLRGTREDVTITVNADTLEEATTAIAEMLRYQEFTVREINLLTADLLTLTGLTLDPYIICSCGHRWTTQSTKEQVKCSKCARDITRDRITQAEREERKKREYYNKWRKKDQ